MFFASGDCLEGLRTIMQVKHIDWFIFDGCDLRDLDLSERNLNGAHFIRVEARGAFFIKSQLQDTDFSEADLRNTYFVEADLRNANFGGADLRGAIFTRADLRGARFYDCFTDEHTTWQDAKFDDDEQEMSPERITDGIKKIDFMDVYLFEEEEA